MSAACRLPIRAAVGDAFSDEEIDAMLARLAARYRRLKSGARVLDDDPALWREAFESLAREEAQETLIEARMRAAAALARGRREAQYQALMRAPVDGGRPLDEGEAFRALAVGTESRGVARGLSADARQKAAEVEAQSAFTGALDDAGQLSRLADPFRAFAPDRAFEDEVAREVARLNGEERAKSADPDATRVAEIIVADQQRLREALNRRGAWIGELPGYISRTTHDAIKVGGGFWNGVTGAARDQARAAWVAYIRPRLAERTFEAVDERALMDARAQIEAEAAARGETLSPSDIERRLDRIAAGAIDAARERFLAQIWTDIVSGYKAGGGVDPDDLDGFLPPPSLARSVSARRVLHWKDADAWIAYERQYGTGSIFQAHLGFLSRGARSEQLMAVYGPSPEAAFAADRQRLTDQARARGDVRAVRRLQSPQRQAELDQLTGAAERAASHRLATFSRALRGVQQLAKLGGMIFSSVTDLGNGAQALSRAGVQHLQAYAGMAESLGRFDTVTKREIADLVGEGTRAIAGDIAAQFVAPDSAMGTMFKLQRVFYRANLFAFWQARLRAGAGTVLARHLGNRRGVAFDALDPDTRAHLARYGIDAGAWDLARGQAAKLGEGWAITPDAAERVDADAVATWAGKDKVPDPDQIAAARDAIAQALDALSRLDEGPDAQTSWGDLTPREQDMLDAAGVNRALWDRLRAAARETGALDGAAVRGVTNAVLARELGLDFVYRADDVADARRELMIRLQAYFTDTIDSSLTEPRARERALMRPFGARTGTVLGTALELMGQFKTFPLTVMTRHLGPAIEEVRTRRVVAPLAHFLAATTALGFVAMTMKDLARGLTPMPLETEDGENQAGKIFVRAFVQGGGGGLYADFLFGEFDRFGRSPFAALLGPSIGEAERLLRISAQLRKGEAAGAVRVAVDNIPFVNLFYTRWALNYLFLHQLQETISPGYLQRMEQRLEQERGQRFWGTPPSEAVEPAA